MWQLRCVLTITASSMLLGCAASSEAASGSRPSGAGPANAETPEYPQLTGGQSSRGVIMALIEQRRSATVEFLGKEVKVRGDDHGAVINADGRRIWMNYDNASQFASEGTPPTSPRAYLEQHMKWRFDVEWAEMLRTVELSRKVRAGEKVDDNTKLTTYAPDNVQLAALPDKSAMLAWEVNLQKATGVVKNDTAVAVMLYRTIPLEKGVLVLKTEVRTNETATADDVRRAFDAHAQRVAFHDGPLDFPRYAKANGWGPLGAGEENAPSAEPPPLHIAQEYCDNGEMRACTDLGFRYFAGSGGVEKDMKQAKAFFAKGCEGKEARSCFGMAGLYANGLGVELDMTQAASFLEKACALGLDEGCTMKEQVLAELKQKKAAQK